MPHVFVSPRNIQGDSFSLEPRESHHVVHVLRKKKSDSIQCFDGEGARFRAEITDVDSSTAIVHGRILERFSDGNTLFVKIHLIQGLPQGTKFDFVIEKATELGVSSIVPFISEKNPIRSNEKGRKLERWKRLAEAGSKQSGRATLPIIEPIQELTDLSKWLQNKPSLLLLADDIAKPMRMVLPPLFEKSPREINLIIGPESGFSEKEIDWFKSVGCEPASMGRNILRTETAGLVALSLVNYELGLL